MQDKQKRSAAQWADLMDAYEASGQTKREFAKANDVTFATFGYWRHKLRRQKPNVSRKAPVAPFVELQATRATEPTAITICIGPASVSFTKLPDPQYLAAVLAGVAR